MTHQQRLENTLYKNWIRGALGLGYVHEGLYGFVNEHSKKHHRKLTAEVLSKTPSNIKECTQCTIDNLLPHHAGTKKKTKYNRNKRLCPNGVCSRMYDSIVEDHAFRDPLWKNTDPTLWCTDHWSISRCFQSSVNFSGSAKYTDASGLLAVITNNLFIQSELATIINPFNTPSKDPFSRAREVRNEILHSPTLELQDTEVAEYIDIFIALLSDRKALHNDEAAKKAIRNLTELKNYPIFISLKDELQLRKEAMLALEEKKSEALSEIETLQDETLSLIQARIDAKDESETEDKTREKINLMSSKLKKINTSQIIYQRKQRQTDDQLKKYEEIQSEMMEKIKLNQESINKQVEHIKHRQISQEQLHIQFSAQIKELQTKIEEFKSPERKIVTEERDQYTTTLEKRIELQTNLITLYQQYYLKTDVSPLLPEEDVDIDEIYVPLIMEKVNNHNTKGFKKCEPVYFYEDVFFRGENAAFRNVFITADAGMGKTTFCRKLTSTWCKVHSKSCIVEQSKSKFRTKENIESRDNGTMSKFIYLFYISLRHTDKERTIEEMICSQLLDESSKDLLISILKEHSDRCLVILDGLDEWEAPYTLPKSPFITSGLPDKEIKMSYVTLYTARPWKLEKIRPKTGEIDVEIKLNGIEPSAAKKLAKAVIEKLNENSQSPIKEVDSFIKYLEFHHFQNLESIPILLKLLTCIWHEQMDIGSSLCGVYSSVLEQLLRIAIERNKHDEQFASTRQKFQTNEEIKELALPVLNIFQNKNSCQNLIQFLKVLSKFAFLTLIGDGEKANLVFGSSSLETFGISDEEMQFCMKSGILSQRMLHGRSALNRCKSVTFIHKTFHEFFAALYVVISDDNEALGTLLRVCKNVEKVLEMGKVIQFIGGMNPDILYAISEHMVKLTDEDVRFTSYRSVDSTRILILMIQDLMFQSVKESIDCYHGTLPMFHLRDVHLWDEDVNKYILNFDPLCMASLSTNSFLAEAELSHITKTRSLKLLCFSGLFGKFPKTEFFDILDRSSQTLVCLAIKTGNIETPEHFKLSKLQYLRKIMLSDVTLNHTTMIRLLSDSVHLCEFYAMCVYCFSDETCQCKHISETETPNTNLVSTEIRKFESRYGCGMLRHISKADRLEELRVVNPNDPTVVNDMIRITKSCKSLNIIQLHGIGSEITSLPFPRNPSSLRSVQLSELITRKETVLDLLKAGQNTDTAFVFEFDYVVLVSGNIETLKEEIENLGIFKIRYFKQRIKKKGIFKHPKYKNLLRSASIFSMTLLKDITEEHSSTM